MAREHLAPSVRGEADDGGGRVLASEEVQPGVVGEAVRLVRRPHHLLDPDTRRPSPAHVRRHVGEEEMVLDRVPDRAFGEGEARGELLDRRVRVDQLAPLGPEDLVRHGRPRSGREPGARRQGRDDRPRHLVEQPADDPPALDLGRPVVDRQQVAGVGEQLLDRRLFLPLGRAVIAGDLRLHLLGDPERLDDLVVEVVDHVAADRRHAVGGVDVDVHRTLRVRPRRLAIQPREDLDRPADLEVQEAQRVLGVQPVDQMLDVGGRVLRMHEARYGIFKLAAVDHDRRVHREEVVLAGVVDVQVGVEDVADVAELEAVPGELVLDQVLVELEPAHAEGLHDRVRAIARVDQHGPRPAQDQKAERRHPAGPAAIAAEHEKARLELDVAIIQDLDLERHGQASLQSSR